MKKIESENFDTVDTGISLTREGKTISSDWFIVREGRKLMSKLGYESDEKGQFAGELISDFARTLKEIVRQELLEEMRKSVNHIETFYR
jgi:hypothetical protein